MPKSLAVQQHCPACGSNRTALGQLSGGTSAATFTPEGLSIRLISSGRLPLQRVARACTECGLVWTSAEAVDLRERIDKAGTDEARRWLADDEDDRPLG
jgi:hypothetical protein